MLLGKHLSGGLPVPRFVKVGPLLKCVNLEDFVLSQADASWENEREFS